MKDCLNCVNYIPKDHEWKCKTMTAPMENYKCYMNAGKVTKAEIDIAKYTIRHNSVARRGE
jgi:hypothetical protein